MRVGKYKNMLYDVMFQHVCLSCMSRDLMHTVFITGQFSRGFHRVLGNRRYQIQHYTHKTTPTGGHIFNYVIPAAALQQSLLFYTMADLKRSPILFF